MSSLSYPATPRLTRRLPLCSLRRFLLYTNTSSLSFPSHSFAPLSPSHSSQHAATTKPHPPPRTPLRRPLLAHIYRLAFTPGKLYTSLFSACSPTEIELKMSKRFTKWIADPKSEVLKAVNAEGEIVGFAFWDLPEPLEGWPQEKEEEGPRKLREFSEGTRVEVARDFFARLDAHEETLPKRSFREFIMLPSSRCWCAANAGPELTSHSTPTSHTSALFPIIFRLADARHRPSASTHRSRTAPTRAARHRSGPRGRRSPSRRDRR